MSTEWELQAALDMVFAARAKNDEAAERLGWLRFSEGLRNVVQSILSSQAETVRVELRVVRDQHREDEANQAHVNLLITKYEADVADRITALEKRSPERRHGDAPHEGERRHGD